MRPFSRAGLRCLRPFSSSWAWAASRPVYRRRRGFPFFQSVSWSLGCCSLGKVVGIIFRAFYFAFHSWNFSVSCAYSFANSSALCESGRDLWKAMAFRRADSTKSTPFLWYLSPVWQSKPEGRHPGMVRGAIPGLFGCISLFPSKSSVSYSICTS